MNDDVDMPTSEQLAEVMAQIKPVGDVLVEVLSGLEIPAWQAIPALALVLGFYMSQKIHEHQEAYDMAVQAREAFVSELEGFLQRQVPKHLQMGSAPPPTR